MKKTFKHLGIITLTAVIIFGSAVNASASDFDYNQMPATNWPSDSVWGQYDLTGLRQPSGTTVHGGMFGSHFIIFLSNADKAAYDNLSAQIRRINGFTMIQEETEDGVTSIAFMSPSFKMVAVSYSISEKVVAIQAM